MMCADDDEGAATCTILMRWEVTRTTRSRTLIALICKLQPPRVISAVVRYLLENAAEAGLKTNRPKGQVRSLQGHAVSVQ